MRRWARFLDGTYAGEYEASLIAEFEKLLPETPPWKKLKMDRRLEQSSEWSKRLKLDSLT